MAKHEALTLPDVEFAVEKGTVDTVFVAFTDLQGRLQGKRVEVRHFMSEVLSSGTAIPAHLLAVDSGMRTAPGHVLSPGDTGFGDLVLRPDLRALFRMPWQEGTIGVLCDVTLPDGTSVVESPRAILARQLRRLEGSNIGAVLDSDLDFRVFEETYETAFSRDYADLTPLTRITASHSGFASARAESLLHRVRTSLAAVPVSLESTVAGDAPGQQELTLLQQEAMRSCDELVIAKNAVKEIAAQDGRSATFMAMYDLASVGNAHHVSLSFRGARGGMTLTDRYDDEGLSPVGRAFIAGQLAHAPELMLLFAPNPNSYRRFGTEPFAPSALDWGRDNRTCAFRVVGADAGLRLENRIPGSDANPYLVAAGMVAAGLDGIQHQRPLGPEATGATADRVDLPTTLEEACTAWEGSEWVEAVFGTEVQRHCARTARLEIEAALQGQEDPLAWERSRYFEVC